MRFLHSVLVGALGAGLLALSATAGAAVDRPADPAALSAPTEVRTAAAPVEIRPAPAPLPGSTSEANDYERREAESPQVQDYAGGEVIIAVSFLGLLLLLLIVLIVTD